jgi:hypothetical protein
VKIDHVKSSVDEARSDLRELRTELRDFRTDVTGRFDDVRSEVYEGKRWLAGMWLTGMLALVGLFVEIVLRG